MRDVHGFELYTSPGGFRWLWAFGNLISRSARRVCAARQQGKALFDPMSHLTWLAAGL